MHNITKKILIVLITIMAYLPMTVVNAMPDVAMPVQTQAVTAMDMATMDMDDCHHEKASTSCDTCLSQHSCHCVHSSCSISFGLTAHYFALSINRNLKNSAKTLRINTQFQQATRLLRPPISS